MSDTPNPPPGEPTPPLPPNLPPAAGAPPPLGSPPIASTPDAADVEKNKVFAILAYVGILVLVPILAAKDSPFAKYHANQGLLLFLASIVIGVVLRGCGGTIFPHIPIIGTIDCCLTCVDNPVAMVAILAFMIMGIINAANGKMKPLPGFPPITLIK